MSEHRRRFVDTLREYEVLYRREGKFESAVQAQMTADGVEALPEERLSTCTWFQRGRDRVPDMFELDGMLGIGLPNGFVHYLTKDAAFVVWCSLTRYLKLTGIDLRSAARQLDEAQHSVTYDEKPFTKDPP